MKVQAQNGNGIGNRFRCFLSALRINRDATIYWPTELQDGVTRPELLNGQIDPLDTLIETDRIREYDSTAWKVPKFSYYVTAAESGNRSVFCLYENMDPRAKKAYYDLKNEFLRPTKAVLDLAVPGFTVGFQIRTKSELIHPPKNEIHPSIINFILDANYPIFVAADSAKLSQYLSQNPYVFCFTNQHKYDFDREWNWSMAEILTMAGCKTLYVSPGSTYGEMGYLFGNFKPIIRSVREKIHDCELASLKKLRIIT